MIELENAEFIGYGKVLVELENGEQIECKTSLRTYANYREWWENMHPDNLPGYSQLFSQDDIDEDNVEKIEILYPDEYTIDNKDFSEPKIKKLIKCIDVDWEVQI